MKRKLILCMLTLCALLLAACGGESGGAEAPQGEGQEEKIDGASQQADAAGDDAAGENGGALPYTVTLDASMALYDEPSYDGCYQQIVGEDGVYTIVEEAEDGEGNRWGKLRSGAGWVDLTAAEFFFQAPPVLTVCYAEEPLLAGKVIEHIVDDSEYMERIALRSRERLTELRLYAVELREEGLALGAELDALDALEAGTALVLGVTFPGDMSMYAIACRDSGGTEHCFTVSVSGRNGALVLNPYLEE